MQRRVNLSVPVSFFKEGKTFIAYSPVLDISTSAATFAKVQKRFDEVVQLFIEDLIDKGTLDEVLTNLGWRKVRSGWNPPVPIGHDVTRVAVPLHA